MKHFYTLCLCCLFSVLAAQPGNTIALEYEDADGNPITSTMEYSKLHSGRSVYTDGTMFVYWTGLQWTIGTSDFEPYFVSEVDTSPNPPDLASGNWRVVHTRTRLIVFNGTGTVDDGDPVKISLTVDAGIDCHGAATGQLTVTANKGVAKYDYVWSNGSSTAGSANSTNSISGLTTGTYGITVTDANGNQATDEVTLAEPDKLLANASVAKHVSCKGSFDGAVSAAATGGTGPYEYAWSFGVTTPSASGLEGGKYSVTVTDARGCEVIEDVTVSEPDAISVQVISLSDVRCHGGSEGSIAVNASGGTAPYTYLWSNEQEGKSLTGLPASTYAVTVTDANGCEAVLSREITQPKELTVSAVVDKNVSCHGEATGTAHVTVSGGTEPYSYAWSNGSTEARITDLKAGDYDVTITDKSGCTSAANLTVNQPAALGATLTVTDVSCKGAGSAGLSVAGGTEPYTFLWSTGAATESVTDLAGGSYSVTVTDKNDCSWVRPFDVADPPALEVTTYSTMDSGAGDGTAGVAVSGGQSPYTYAWNTDPVATTADVSGLSSGVYTVEVTDASGCSQLAMVKVSLGIPGDVCGTAIAVDSLLGGSPDDPKLLSAMDNGDYWKKAALPAELSGCFSGADSLYHPVWFSFVGDGDSYRVSLADCDGDDCLPENSLYAAILEGSCGQMKAVTCNEGVPAGRSRSDIEIKTGAGVRYFVLIDGKAGATGRFQLAMTAMSTTSVAHPVAKQASVFPNPTDGVVRITGIRPRRVEVFSNLGRLLNRVETPATAVDLAGLPAGVYTLRITDWRNEIHTARVVRK